MRILGSIFDFFVTAIVISICLFFLLFKYFVFLVCFLMLYVILGFAYDEYRYFKNTKKASYIFLFCIGVFFVMFTNVYVAFLIISMFFVICSLIERGIIKYK